MFFKFLDYFCIQNNERKIDFSFFFSSNTFIDSQMTVYFLYDVSGTIAYLRRNIFTVK